MVKQDIKPMYKNTHRIMGATVLSYCSQSYQVCKRKRKV